MINVLYKKNKTKFVSEIISAGIEREYALANEYILRLIYQRLLQLIKLVEFVREQLFYPLTTYSRFYHDVTKNLTKELSILLSFYFHITAAKHLY